MGTSHPESRPWSIKKILSSNPKSILDVGAGSGTYLEALKKKGYSGKIDAIEIWEPYINEFNLEQKYDNLYKIDVRDFNQFNYDVVIFGDILEHMTRQEAIDLWNKASSQAKNILLAIPIIHCEQGHLNGNPYEVHVEEDWEHDQIIKSFHGIKDHWQGEIVGAYWANFR